MQPVNSLALFVFSIAIAFHGLATDGRCQSETAAQLYFFTNPGCGPCRQVEPELEQLYREGYSVMKIDTSIHPDWTQRFQVTRTPTVVLVANGKVVGRKCGFINAATLREWFRRVASSGPATDNRLVTDARSRTDSIKIANDATTRNLSDTMRNGTQTPANEVERTARQATVRLKVDDPRGSSYATGTVVHYRSGEALVLTCGHVFRDSNGAGTISAEYGFEDGRISRTQGELLYYDSDDRDIGLVAITTDREIRPVPVANADYPIQQGDQIFSIGCDHGESPTIRRSRVKNQARYDGVNKYEIYGRPVDGRSGGGMFTAGGQLVGVCNAAVVDADEGVYVALDTIHWQFHKVKLSHLFNPATNIAQIQQAQPERQPMKDVSPRAAAVSSRLADVPVQDRLANPYSSRTNTGSQINTTNVVHPVPENSASQAELIVVLRSRDSNGTTQSWTVDNPSHDLIQHLRELSRPDKRNTPVNRMARLRQTMPDLQNAGGKSYNAEHLRAQSPR